MTSVFECKRGPGGPHPEIDLPGSSVSDAMRTATYLPLRRPR